MTHRIGWARGLRALAVGAAGAALAFGGGCGDSAAPATKSTTVEARDDRFAYARGLFNEMCAGCHTLADAGARGPESNLDTSILSRINRQAREQVTRIAMEEDPSNGGFMPRWKGVLTKRDFEALVVYIVEVTGRGSR